MTSSVKISILVSFYSGTSGKNMERFFIYTRGRTGSTAIVDELAQHSKLFMMMEIFGNYTLMPQMTTERLKELYPVVMPYYVWRKERANHALINKKKFAHLLKFKLLKKHQIDLSLYLEILEEKANDKKVSAFGFKILDSQFHALPYLAQLIKAQSFKAIYLQRENAVKRVLSSMIAIKRKLYNSKKKDISNDSYLIDVNEFEGYVRGENELINKDKQVLHDMGLDTLEVTYEDFCNDRTSFYKEIFNFLNVPYEPLNKTDYSIMIPDLTKVVSNYEELKTKVCAMNMEKWLN